MVDYYALKSAFKKEIKKDLTVVWHEIEHWQRDNPAILSGYRPESRSYWISFSSLFYLHNESVNVYSHLIGAIAFAIGAPILHKRLKPLYRTASKEDVVVFGCFFFGAVFCMGTSGIYHLISNHSSAVSKWGNQLDYLGIVLLIWGSFIPSLYYGFQDLPNLIKVYWTMITTIGFATAYASVAPSFRSPAYRPLRALLFTGMGLSAVIPAVHGFWIFGYKHLNETMALNWVVLQGGLYLAGAMLYGGRIPEKYFPGKFDLYFASHQIFHFLVVAAAISHLRGLVKAFHSKHTGPRAHIKVASSRNKIE